MNNMNERVLGMLIILKALANIPWMSSCLPIVIDYTRTRKSRKMRKGQCEYNWRGIGTVHWRTIWIPDLATRHIDRFRHGVIKP